jgi:hypothetical protein
MYDWQGGWRQCIGFLSQPCTTGKNIIVNENNGLCLHQSDSTDNTNNTTTGYNSQIHLFGTENRDYHSCYTSISSILQQK